MHSQSMHAKLPLLLLAMILALEHQDESPDGTYYSAKDEGF